MIFHYLATPDTLRGPHKDQMGLLLLALTPVEKRGGSTAGHGTARRSSLLHPHRVVLADVLADAALDALLLDGSMVKVMSSLHTAAGHLFSLM
jgi:hypothetical protein